MSMDDLYEEMKSALSYFGLRFSAKDQVKVYICDDRLIFEFEGREISIPLEQDLI